MQVSKARATISALAASGDVMSSFGLGAACPNHASTGCMLLLLMDQLLTQQMPCRHGMGNTPILCASKCCYIMNQMVDNQWVLSLADRDYCHTKETEQRHDAQQLN